MSVAAHQTACVHSYLPNCTCSTTHNPSQAHISYGTYVTAKLYWLLSNSSDICHSVCHYNTCDTHCDVITILVTHTVMEQEAVLFAENYIIEWNLVIDSFLVSEMTYVDGMFVFQFAEHLSRTTS